VVLGRRASIDFNRVQTDMAILPELNSGGFTRREAKTVGKPTAKSRAGLPAVFASRRLFAIAEALEHSQNFVPGRMWSAPLAFVFLDGEHEFDFVGR
jgi:hypothetical protein